MGVCRGNFQKNEETTIRLVIIGLIYILRVTPLYFLHAYLTCLQIKSSLETETKSQMRNNNYYLKKKSYKGIP